MDRYGPWAVILGATDGTGAAFAREIASKGISCVLVARRADKLDELAAELSAAHAIDCVTVTANLAQRDAIDRIRAGVGQREVGLLVANAGADSNGSHFLDTPLPDWEALAQVNVGTKLACCHHFGGAMRQQGRGGIILVGSGACYGGGPYLATYSGVKAFSLNFAEGLWAELKPHGVDVLATILGQTDTPAFRKLLAEKGMPVPEGLAAPQDVAALCLARLSDGPILNWGLDNADAGNLPQSAEQRKARVEMIARASARVFGSG